MVCFLDTPDSFVRVKANHRRIRQNNCTDNSEELRCKRATAHRICQALTLLTIFPKINFIVELRQLNGTPEDVLEHPELMKLLIPLLRADFEVVESYVAAQYQPLDCPITSFGGINDTEVPRENLAAWSEHTTMAFALHMFPGDHFFLHAAQPHLIRIIVQGLIR